MSFVPTWKPRCLVPGPPKYPRSGHPSQNSGPIKAITLGPGSIKFCSERIAPDQDLAILRVNGACARGSVPRGTKVHTSLPWLTIRVQSITIHRIFRVSTLGFVILVLGRHTSYVGAWALRGCYQPSCKLPSEARFVSRTGFPGSNHCPSAHRMLMYCMYAYAKFQPSCAA